MEISNSALLLACLEAIAIGQNCHTHCFDAALLNYRNASTET